MQATSASVGFWNKMTIWVNGTPWSIIARGYQLQKGIILQLTGNMWQYAYVWNVGAIFW